MIEFNCAHYCYMKIQTKALDGPPWHHNLLILTLIEGKSVCNRPVQNIEDNSTGNAQELDKKCDLFVISASKLQNDWEKHERIQERYEIMVVPHHSLNKTEWKV